MADVFTDSIYGPQFTPRQQVQSQPLAPLSEEEKQTILQTIGHGALHGLGYVGSSMSKALGGRAIRGLMGGNARELASIIPFSDAMGITDPGQEVHGSELITGQKDTPFFSPEGITGLGVDILTDPATYLTFGAGAVTKLGKAAQMAGNLPKTGALRAAGHALGTPEAAALASKVAQVTGKPTAAADVARQALGGHIGVGLPFMGNAATFNLAPVGNVLAAAAGKVPGAGRVSQMVNSVTEPLGRIWNAGFKPEMMDQVTAEGQAIAPTFFGAKKAGQEAGRLKAAELMRTHGAADLLTDPQGLRRAIETPGSAVSPGAQAAAGVAAPELTTLYNRRAFLGDSKDLLENYFPRQVVQPELDVAKDFFAKHAGAREDILGKHSVEALNKMVADPVVGTAARTAPDAATAAAHLVANHGIPTPDAEQLAGFLHSLHPARQNTGLFARDAIHDYMTHMAAGEARVNMLRELYPAITQHAGPATPGSTAIPELLDKMGLNPNAQKRAFEALDNAGVLAGATQAAKEADFATKHVPLEVANALGAIIKPDIAKDGAFSKLVKKIIDAPSNLFRGHVTQPFPGFHERNAATSLGWIQTVLTGSPKAALEGNQMMTDLLRGKVIDGISQWAPLKGMGLTDAQASDYIGNLMFSKGLTQSGAVSDVLGHSATPSSLEGLPGMMPGRKVGLEAVPEYVKKWVPRSGEQANPLNMRGIGGRPESTFAPAAAGEKLATVIEQTGRGGGFLALLKQGFEPDMAAAMTKAAHVDYTNLTTFEREVMRRLVPFYSWARGNIPYQLKQVMENPGGMTANALKASASAEGPEPGLNPGYLGQGVVAGLGKTAEGKQRFLHQLGMPFEDLGNLTSAGALMGQLNPVLKYVAEQATGRQLNTGRELSTLHPLPSSLQGLGPNWAENAIANSPFTRYISAGRTLAGGLTDPGGSALNLLTGARVTDVNQEAAKRQAIEEFARNVLAKNPAIRRFQNLSVPAEMRGQLTPQESFLLRLANSGR